MIWRFKFFVDRIDSFNYFYCFHVCKKRERPPGFEPDPTDPQSVMLPDYTTVAMMQFGLPILLINLLGEKLI